MIRLHLKYAWVCWVVAFFAFAGCADKAIAPTARASVSRQHVRVLEPFQYVLTICASQHIQIELPDFTKAFGSSRVKDTKESVRFWWGKQYIRRQFVLEAPVAKDVEIPSLVVRYRLSDTAQWQELKTQSYTIRVKSMLPQGTAVADIRDIKPLLGNFPIWVLIMGTVVCIGGVLIWLFRRKKNTQTLSPPPEPAHLRALEKLNILQQEELLRKGRLKEYFSRLGDIVREYIELRFAIRAQELTTEEFLVFVRDNADRLGQHVALLSQFLETCDMVKFARYQPQAQEADAAYEAARRFIEETKRAGYGQRERITVSV